MPAPLSRPVRLHGCVISGRGTASRSVVGPSPISDFFGELQAPGSLNVALDGPVRFNPEQVAIPKEGRAYYWPAAINGTRCLLTRADGHPLHVVEILSPLHLRKEFNLRDGDAVTIEISPNLTTSLSRGAKTAWSIFWGFRGRWYASRTYRALIGPFWLLRRIATQAPKYQAKVWNRAKSRTAVPLCHINLARDPKLRGGERQTEILVHALVAEGVPKQRVVILQRGPLAKRFLNSDRLEVCRVRNRMSAAWACRKAALVHAHEAHAAQAAYAARLLWSAPYLITRRLTKPVRNNFYSSAVYRNAQTVVALTQAVEDGLRNRFPKLSITRIPDAWNPTSPDAEAVRRIRKQFAGKFLIGHAAAMDGPEKGHAVLIEAARILQPQCPDAHFLLLGSGRLQDALQHQASDLDNMHFAGWVEDPAPWIAAFDLFAFPSLIEPLGSTLLDVLRAGIPTVASRVDGIPEVITEECGVLVPPGDAAALAEQLLHLHRSEELRRRLAEAGRMRAKQYDPALIARRHLEAYRAFTDV